MKYNAFLIAASLSWAVGLAAVCVSIWRYEATPGRTADRPADWPAGVSLGHPEGAPVLVVFLHPHCPCSGATMRELEALRSLKWSGATHVVFVTSASAPAGWEHGELSEAAARLPDVIIHRDAGGALAQQFGATTSGYAVLFDGNGRRVFAGGLTPTRGGDAGGAALRLALEGKVQERLVFGCPLFDDEDEDETP